MMFHGHDVTSQILLKARELCYIDCRAKFCEDRGRCLDTWPSCGSGLLKSYFEEAMRLLRKNDRSD